MLVEMYPCHLAAVFITSSDSADQKKKKFFLFFAIKLAAYLEGNIMSGPSQYI